MAFHCRSLTRPAISLLKSTITKPSIKHRPAAASSFTVSSSPTISRLVPRLGSLESLLPLHSAVASARLTSCLGIDSMSSRSLSQGRGHCPMIHSGAKLQFRLSKNRVKKSAAPPVPRRIYFIPNAI